MDYEITSASTIPGIQRTDTSRPTTTGKLPPRFWWIAGALILALLLPALLLPAGPDAGVFFSTAEKLLHGGIHYRDTVDVKPPLIYYLYAVAIAILGDSTLSMRILDLIIQCATSYLLVLLIRKVTGNDYWALATGICYALLYGSLDFASGMQAESYVGLFGVGALFLTLVRPSTGRYLLVGILAGALIFFKFTLAAVPAGLMVALLLDSKINPRQRFRSTSLIFLGTLIPVLLFATYLFAFGALEGFKEMNVFIRGYSAVTTADRGDLILRIWRYYPIRVLSTYTLVIAVFTAVGIINGFGKRFEAEKKNTAGNTRLLLRYTTVIFVFLILSSFAEGRFYSYHLSRYLAFGSVLAAFPFEQFVNWVRNTPKTLYSKIGLSVMAAVMLLYGPASNWVWYSATPAILRLVASNSTYLNYYERMLGSFQPVQFGQVASYFQQHRKPSDHLFVISTTAGLIYHEAHYIPDFRIYHSAFLMSDFGPPSWRLETARYITTNQPEYFVFQKNDDSEELTGNKKSSEDVVNILPGVDSLLRASYDTVLVNRVYVMYHKH